MFSTSGFGKAAHFRFGVETGSRKVDGAKVQVELYTPPKFHANRLMCLGGVNMGHLKYNASKLLEIKG